MNKQSASEVRAHIEEHFPFVPRPTDSDLYAYSEGDAMRQLIDQSISGYIGPALPYEGVIYLHDELGTLTPKAMQWILPSALRLVIANTGDPVSDLIFWLIWLIEDAPDADTDSAYDLSWMKLGQRDALMCLLTYLSQELEEDFTAAQQSLRILRSKG